MRVICIVASAGKGKRLGLRKDKPFVELGGKPILARTLKVIEECSFIDGIIVVVARGKLKACEMLVKKHGIRKVMAIVTGGRRRFDSVRNALARAKDADYIMIHDGARPFIDPKSIKKVFFAARKFGASLPAVPLKQTPKFVDKKLFIKKTPDRRFLWEAQTPQIFKAGLIQEAYRKAPDRNATDDSILLERLGHRVKIVTGPARNIKITTPEDLKLAEALLKK